MARIVIRIAESAFYLLPRAVRYRAPDRQTPVLREPLTAGHHPTISRITLDWHLFVQMQERAYDAASWDTVERRARCA